MAHKTETPKWMKRLVRARMKETGEKYTKTLRDIKAEHEKEVVSEGGTTPPSAGAISPSG